MYLAIDIELLVKDIKNRYTVVNAKFWKNIDIYKYHEKA